MRKRTPYWLVEFSYLGSTMWAVASSHLSQEKAERALARLAAFIRPGTRLRINMEKPRQ